MRRSLRSLIFPVAAFALPLMSGAQTARPLPRYTGLQGCASSSCHGGAELAKNQTLIWARKDFHHKALAILATSRSERIAEALKLANGPFNQRCTTCHSPFYTVGPEHFITPAAKHDEGVSCESCHGPAEPWLRSHTRPDYTHAQRVASGMRNLRDLTVRATSCVACHENIDSDITKAGHPQMAFELDRMTQHQPPHWRDEGEWFGLNAWLTGQAVALRERSWKLQHESDPEALARWAALSWMLHEVTSEIGISAIAAPAANPGAEHFATTQRDADRLAREGARFGWSLEKARALRKKLAAFSSLFDARESGAIKAQQAIVLSDATDRLSVALASGAPSPELVKQLETLSADARRIPFDGASFRKNLEQLAAAPR